MSNQFIDRILLSVVVVIVSDTTNPNRNVDHLTGCLDALQRQVNPPPMEILVPYLAPVEGLDQLKREFPNVIYEPIENLETHIEQGGSREHHDELRARGLARAQGVIVGLLEDHGHADSNWCTRAVELHSQRFKEYAAVGGAIENGIDRALNWAVYFCDFAKYMNPVADGDSLYASDANISYKRSALESIKPIWQDAFHETTVNWELVTRGNKLAVSSNLIAHQHRLNLRLFDALKERFVWGRSYAATRSKLVGRAKRLVLAVFTPILPAVLTLRMAMQVIRKGRNHGAFLKALPFIVLLTIAWACGELAGYMTSRVETLSAQSPKGESKIVVKEQIQ